MKYKNYLFDCGNVLFSFSKKLLLEKYVDNEADRDLLAAILFKYWELQDLGVESHEFYKYMQMWLPTHLHEACYNIIFHWDLWISPFEDMDKLVRRLKETGHKLYLLSNMPSTFVEDHSKLPLLDIFDGLLFSYSVKCQKPDPMIYEHAVRQFDLKRDETIFVDDNPVNIKGGEDARFATYLFDKNNREAFIKYVTEIEGL